MTRPAFPQVAALALLGPALGSFGLARTAGGPRQEPPAGVPKSLQARRIQGPITLDGRLEEESWATAPAASGFTTEWPVRGQPARQRTEVKVLYDDHFVYVGARMFHDPALEGGRARIIRRLHRRDQDSQADWFGVAIDSLHDGRTAFLFEVNAAGVQKDQVIFQDTNFDASWDGVWESAVGVDDLGWTAELKIPLSLLRLHNSSKNGGGAQTWGINFNRSDQGPVREFTRWHLVSRGENAFVSRFPELTGIEGVKPQARREWLPYLSAARKFETTETFDDRKWDGKAGLDARIGLNTYSQLDLAIRPDFGQVEVDQVVLNLSTIETFFPEKRPFFLEGAEIFSTVGPTLFYSRRIGRGLGTPDAGEGETLLEHPLATEIAGAAKYTVKTEGGLNFGALGAGVENEQARFRGADGRVFRREIAPYTSYGVVRAQQLLDARGSYLGGFVSAMREAGASGREAFVGALDGVLKSADRSGTLDFSLVRSQTGPKGGDRPSGWFGRLGGAKQWANGWSLNGLVVNVGHDFNINDLGYRSRYDEQFVNFWGTKRWDRTWGVLRNWEWGFDSGLNRDQRGRIFNRWIGTRAKTDFTNYVALWASGGTNLPVEDDRELRTYGDPVKKYLHVKAIPYAQLGFDTPGNKPWYFRATVNRAWHEGGPSTDTSVFQLVKPLPALEFQFSTSYTLDEGERRWLETAGDAPSPVPGQSAGTPITGLRRLSELNQVVRVSYAFNPRLTVQLFAQWLGVSWAFRDLKAYVDDHTLAPATTANPTAFSFRASNINLITRWEFRPGSAFFIVYTHGASTDELLNGRGSLSPYADLKRLQHLKSDDVVQFKASWLFR